jgi:hypothetical protein
MDTDTVEELEEQEQEQEQEGTAGANLFDSLFAAAEEDGVDIDEASPQSVSDTQEASEPKKKVKRIHKKEIIDPDVPDATQTISQAEQALPEEDPFMGELLPEEKQHLEVVKRIAKKSGNAEDVKLVEFFKKNKEYIEGRLQGEPDLDLSHDEDYQSFVARNRPNISQTDLRDAEMDMVAERAEAKAYNRLAPRVAAQERSAAVAKIMPRVNKLKEEATAAVTSIVPEDMSKLIQEHGAENVQKSMPYEYEIVDKTITNASHYAQRLIDVTSGVDKFNPQDPVHRELTEWINEEEEVFIQSGETKDNSGRPFIRRERYLRLPQSERNKYWTWGDTQLIQIMYARARESMDQALGEHKQKLSAYGNSPAPKTAQRQPPTPRPTRVAPRTGGTPVPQQDNGNISPLSLLGM